MEEKKDQSTSGKNMKVFVDTNILLDYLLKRQPFYESAKKDFEKATIPVLTTEEFVELTK